MADESMMGGSAPGASIADIVSAFNNSNQNMSLLIRTIMNIFPRINGTFTLANATTTIVTQPDVSATSIIIPVATNSAASVLIRTRGLFVSTQTAGVSFTMSTDNGTAAGTETFKYIIVNPS